MAGGLPLGGTYSGAGVTNGTFNTSIAGLGLHTIIYTYKNSAGCSGSTTGTIYVDVTTGINEFNNSGMNISPNSFTSATTITFSSEQKNTSLIITDVLGNMVNDKRLIVNGKSATIDLSGVAKGIYFVRITDENKNVTNRKIVVQ